MQWKKKLLPWLVVFIIVFVFLIYYSIRQSTYTAKIDLLVAPASSKILINGHGRGSGTINAKPGTYKITVSMTGFSADTVTISVAKNQTKSVGIVLVSDSPSTEGWYLNHPSDEKIAEGISSKQNVAAAQQAVSSVPLIKLLPFTGPNFEYQINYGSKTGSNSPIPIIYITAQSQQADQDALAWIRSVGYDPSKMTIEYVNAAP